MSSAKISLLVSVATLAARVSAQSTAPSPEARLTFVNNQVEITAPERRPARVDEVLVRGTRLVTREGSVAEITLADRSRLRLGENTTLVMFAPASRPPAGIPPSDDTTLVRGRITVRCATEGDRRTAVSLATPGATVVVSGDAVLHVDAGRTTRIAVHSGRVRVRAAGREIAVRAGSGVRVEMGRPPQPPRALVAPPSWVSPPPEALLFTGVPHQVRGVFTGSNGTTPATQWHLQLARDEDFRDLLVDRIVPGNVTTFEAANLGPGTYFARVSGIDQDRIEGTPGPVARVVITAPRVIPGGNGRRATVEIPQGFYCGLDGGALVPAGRPLQLAAGRNHTLRCATRPDGTDAVDIPIRGSEAGPLVRNIRVEPAGFDASGGMRVVVLQLSDGAGMPVSYANITATVSPGASIEPFRETDRRGTYTATVHWRRGVTGVRLRINVNDAEQFDYVLGHPPDVAVNP